VHRRNERGAGTLLTAGICLALLAVAWTASMVVGWLAQIGSVQDSADLASLAAASAHAQRADGCAAAKEVAARNQSDLMECHIDGDAWSFVVEVRVSQPLRPSLLGIPQLIERVASAGTIQ